MIYLFIHQHFPGQYGHVVRFLAAQPENAVYFISQQNDGQLAGVTRVIYDKQPRGALNCHPLTVDLDDSIRVGVSVAEVCRKLRDEGLRPDVIVGHGGWGETLFVKDLFPDVPVLTYFEYYYHARGADLNFDPEYLSVFHEPPRLRTRNAISLMAYDATDWGHTPTLWQRSLLPPELRKRVTVLHEGVDTQRVRPKSGARFAIASASITLTQRDEVITYSARNLEPYRGFHIFMRALPEILRRRPKARIVIAGGDGPGYGAPTAPNTCYREMLLAELGNRIDLSRVHFLGRIEYDDYLRLLQVSSVHVYLTYPFILSWSFVEAMASGCLVVGSATAPVLEFLKDRVNGLTVDFFSPQKIAELVDEALDHPDRMQALRNAARQFAVDHFDLRKQILPRWQKLFDDLANGQRPALDP